MDKLIWPLCALVLVGCSSDIGPAENAAGGVPFVLEEFFDGKLKAHGVILSRGGKVRRSFVAEMTGTWREESETLQGVLTEVFVFDDGERLERRWELRKTGEGRFAGGAADVEGVTTLETSGNALRMDYRLLVPVGGRTLAVDVEDWLWRMESGVVVNKSVMRKWGFRVGEIITSIVKDE